MILPTSLWSALVLGFVGLLMIGLWPNTVTAPRKWRFEVYYLDFALGALLASIIAGMTLGSMGQELTFLDNLDISGRRQLAYGVAAGAIFNLGNLLAVGAMSVSGMAVAFGISWSVAFVVAGGSRFLFNPPGNPGLWAGAICLAAVAAACAVVGQKASGLRKWWKPAALAIAAGIPLGSFGRVVDLARSGDIGLGPYPILFLMSLGVFISTFVYDLYFINLPVEGPVVSVRTYLAGTRKQHLLGLLGGAMWVGGTLAVAVSASSPAGAKPDASLEQVFLTGGAAVTMLSGLLYRKEAPKGRLYLWLATALYLAAVALSALAL